MFWKKFEKAPFDKLMDWYHNCNYDITITHNNKTRCYRGTASCDGVSFITDDGNKFTVLNTLKNMIEGTYK